MALALHYLKRVGDLQPIPETVSVAVSSRRSDDRVVKRRAYAAVAHETVIGRMPRVVQLRRRGPMRCPSVLATFVSAMENRERGWSGEDGRGRSLPGLYTL